MPNHIHLAVKIRAEHDVIDFLRKLKQKPNHQGFENTSDFSYAISQQFSNLFNAHIKAYNKMFDRKGSLFIPNFKRKQVENDNYFAELIVYIHNNPVHHGFVSHFFEWTHSSIHAYLLNKPTKQNLFVGMGRK